MKKEFLLIDQKGICFAIFLKTIPTKSVNYLNHKIVKGSIIIYYIKNEIN
jgi:hypothetical protein